MINDIIKEEVKKWIKKAESDLRAAKRSFGFEEDSWIVTFHSQQAIEKLLKAFLTFNQVRFRKTHDILELLEMCIKIDKEFESLFKLDLEKFKEYATEYRYPSYYEPTLEEAKEAIEIAEKVKEFVLKKLKEKGLEI